MGRLDQVVRQLPPPAYRSRSPTELMDPHAFVVVCELDTGIVCYQHDGRWARILNGNAETHIPFATNADAISFIRSTITVHPALECSLFDSTKTFIDRYFKTHLP
ncbi:hypothetical protein GCM10023156_04850 [Novipirellula rosea]|uniref:Uncharacterized protein n=1 Tax=Novipirellula rosea TaxID=1031540 RepID=A0ABP8M6F5_9BACT